MCSRKADQIVPILWIWVMPFTIEFSVFAKSTTRTLRWIGLRRAVPIWRQ